MNNNMYLYCFHTLLHVRYLDWGKPEPQNLKFGGNFACQADAHFRSSLSFYAYPKCWSKSITQVLTRLLPCRDDKDKSGYIEKMFSRTLVAEIINAYPSKSAQDPGMQAVNCAYLCDAPSKCTKQCRYLAHKVLARFVVQYDQIYKTSTVL